MAAGYILQALQLSGFWDPVLKEVIVGLIILIRLSGFDVLVKFSTALTIITLLPSVIFIGYLFPHVDPSLWLDTSGRGNCTEVRVKSTTHFECTSVPIEWSQLLPFVMWLWSGFFSISSIAGQVCES